MMLLGETLNVDCLYVNCPLSDVTSLTIVLKRLKGNSHINVFTLHHVCKHDKLYKLFLTTGPSDRRTYPAAAEAS
jgi:hypothetical protein